MADIFISYLREDIEAAEKLAEALEAHGWSVFWDRHIPAGKRFDDFLDEQLQAAHCVVVLWSRGSIHSPWVKDEAAVGRDRGILVPARLDDVLAPFGFRAIQAANLIGWQGDPSEWGFQQLLRDVRAAIEVPARVLAGTGEPTPPISRPEEAEAKRRAAEEERQQREQQEAEAKRRAAEEERQQREQQEAEAKRRAAEEERQKAEVKRKLEEEAQLKPEATKEWGAEKYSTTPASHEAVFLAPSPQQDLGGAAVAEAAARQNETFSIIGKSGSLGRNMFIAFILFVLAIPVLFLLGLMAQ